MKQKKAKCKNCGKKNSVESSLLLNLKAYCDYECATEFGKKNIEKGEKIKRQEYNKETARLKKDFSLTDTKGQKELTQKAFNKMRKLQELMWFKLRGKEPECISCGKTNMDWCCGHFKTVGSSGHLRFDEKNTYLQCNRYCNMGLSGNISGNKVTRGYTQGLIDRFSEDEANSIFEYCEKDAVKKWSCEELIEMRTGFFKEIRKLELILN